MSKINNAGNNEELEKLLRIIYYDPTDPGSLGGIGRLYARAQKLKEAKVYNGPLSKEKIERFLANERASSLHRPARRHFPRNPTVSSQIDKQWQADLADMQKLSRYNDGVKYLLTVIDILSKFAWVIPLKDKSAKSLVPAFRHLLDNISYPRKPVLLQTDKGKEFLNNDLQVLLRDVYKIKHFYTWSDKKAAVVERFNRTLKTRIAIWLSANPDTHRYIEVLPQIVNSYNNSYHRSIGMSPNEVNKGNELLVWRKLYGDGKKIGFKTTRRIKKKIISTKERLLKVGTKVRISRVKGDFEKGYMPNWSAEHFVIDRIENADHNSTGSKRFRKIYRLKDSTGEVVSGGWYAEELLPINRNQFLIEKILRRRTNPTTGIKEVLVKWLGWPSNFSNWIPEDDLAKV